MAWGPPLGHESLGARRNRTPQPPSRPRLVGIRLKNSYKNANPSSFFEANPEVADHFCANHLYFPQEIRPKEQKSGEKPRLQDLHTNSV